MADEIKPEAAAPAAAPAPKAAAPAKPAGKPPAKAGQDRRFFLFTWFGSAWAAFTLAMTAMFFGTLRFMFPNVLNEPPSTFKAGSPDGYAPGQVVELFKEKYGVWIVRRDNEVFALSTICTHLGCTPNWLEAEQKFKCPCHGSGFMKDGTNFEGPAPRPLERYKISIADDGQLQIDKTRKFQKELGQWTDSDSYVKLT